MDLAEIIPSVIQANILPLLLRFLLGLFVCTVEKATRQASSTANAGPRP